MRILETIAQTLRSARAHPTTVLNALIELENAGGSSALYELEYRLARLVRAMRERDDHALPIAQGWLNATRAYCETHAQTPAIPAAKIQAQTGIHARVLSSFSVLQPHPPQHLMRSA